ncbi:MAG: carbohydrate porin, partial [Planctomycetota bacterium]
MRTMKRPLCIVAAVFCLAALCQAEDSLDAKIAKLEAASRTRQASQQGVKTTVNAPVTLAEQLRGKVKTLAERLDELESRQKGMQEFSTGLDARLAELERNFEVSKAQSQEQAQKSHEALYAKLTELENKIQGLEARSHAAAANASSAATGTSSPAEPQLSQTSPETSSGRPVLTAQVTESPNKVKGVEAHASASPEPVATNLLNVTAVPDPDDTDIWNRETLTNGFGGLADKLADSGIEVGLSMTNIYQANVRGGLDTHGRKGRHTGSYDLEIGADLEKLWGIEGGSLLAHAEGSWSRSDTDTESVGSVFGINADAGGRRAMDLTELWYEQAMFDDTLRLRLGKMDITGGFECRGCPVSFDGSAYANDETAQFLNGALVNNPTIPFPEMGLGAVLYWNPVEWWYASVGAIDAQGDPREAGFHTAFHGQDYFFYAAETGMAPHFDGGNGPMMGAYRIGMWYDPQEKERFSDGRMRRDDAGFYMSCDQMLHKENDDPEDSQGLGVFTRTGWASEKVNDLSDFWSFGVQYQGVFEGRDDDVLGLGFAKGVFSNQAGYSDEHESV